MLKEELVKKNPLRVLHPAQGDACPDYRMGLVIARAGLGKTAILVQIALDSIMRGQKVLHVSIGQSLEKAKAWYDDIFRHLVEGQSSEKVVALDEDVLRSRMIMTFKESSFSRPKLEERLNDLVYQNIFRPDCVVVDGLDFTAADRDSLLDLRELMVAMNVQVWFSALSHRDDTRVSTDGIPAPCHEVGDLFDTVILLQAEQQGIRLEIIKDTTGCASPEVALMLDPSTMMVKAV
ncbi:MAG: hypothetical protein A2521_02770 [Deltaproteobacteria bacterium RIFOXYD12_FULL_57_12]|nr:MAG: hypothetical protein A2521_02770 [Deltaproteobacteria bacterium RIFOXYD12_FULL_57_12]